MKLPRESLWGKKRLSTEVMGGEEGAGRGCCYGMIKQEQLRVLLSQN